jgi:Anti-sigma-K factor rskA
LTCEERQDLMLLYLTDNLSAEETQELRRHLASGCPTCAGALAEAEATLAAIPLALNPVAPTAAAKGRLMERVADSIQANRIPDSLPLRLFRILIPAAIAACLAIIATHYVVMQTANEWMRKAQTYQTLIDGQSQEVVFLKEQLANQKDILKAMESPGLKLVELDGGKLQPGAVANLFWDQKAQTWTLVTQGVTAPVTGKNYVLWYITAASQKVRAGSFNVDSMGCAAMKCKIPPDLGPLAIAAVTDEPIDSTGQPTGSIQLAAKLQ